MREVYHCAVERCEATFVHPDTYDCADLVYGTACRHLRTAGWKPGLVRVYLLTLTRSKVVQSSGRWLCPEHSR